MGINSEIDRAGLFCCKGPQKPRAAVKRKCLGTDKVGGQPFYGVIDRVTIGTVDDVVNVNIGRPVRSFEPLLWNNKETVALVQESSRFPIDAFDCFGRDLTQENCDGGQCRLISRPAPIFIDD